MDHLKNFENFCLPEKFGHFYSAWDLLAEVDKTLLKLLERLQQEEQRMKSRESQTVGNALMSKGKSGKKNPIKNKQEKSSNSSQSNQQSGKIKCFKCGKEGHKKSDCHGKPGQEYIEYCKKTYKYNNLRSRSFCKCPKLKGKVESHLSQ